MIPISSGSQPGVDQCRRCSGVEMTVLTASTAGTLWIVLRICKFWYRWQRLHQPLDVVSLSTPILRT